MCAELGRTGRRPVLSPEFREREDYSGVGGKGVILCDVVQDLEPDLEKHVRKGCF